MRKLKFTRSVSLLVAAGVLSLSVLAVQAKPVEVEAVSQTSAELSAELGKKWGKILTEGYGLSPQGLSQFVSGYASYPQEVLKNALNAKNFEAMNRTLMDHNQQLVNALGEKIRNEEGTMDVEIHKIKAESSKLLGDEARDLVYIPIAPCRTFDTRTSIFTGFNGVVVPGSPKSAYVAFFGSSSTWIQYGGTVDSCPDTTQTGGPLAGTYPYSVAVNLTVITPVGSGWATVYRGDLPDPSNTVVSAFVQNGVTSTALVVANVCRGVTGASCINDIRIATRGTTAHVGGDVVGYFIRPQATALECTNVSGTVQSVAVNAYAQLVPFPACAAAYTPVATFFAAGSDVVLADSGEGYMYVKNLSTSAQNVQPRVRCCRIPGR